METRRIPLGLACRHGWTEQGGLVFDWPGSALIMDFEGASPELVFREAACQRYNVYVDDAPARVVQVTAGESRVTLPCSPGRHRLRLAKRDESKVPTVLAGCFLGEDTRFFPVAEQMRRKILFIGDSFSLGYGNEWRPGGPEDAGATTNTDVAWTSLLARELDRDYRICAVSGRGLVRNHADGFPTLTMPVLWQRPWLYAEDVHAPAHEPIEPGPAFLPDAICVCLGINDLTRLGPGEHPASPRDFRRGMIAFLAALRQSHPGARIVLTSLLLGDDPVLCDVIAALVAEEVAAGRKDIGHLVLPRPAEQWGGLHAHPTVEQHRDLARSAQEQLRAILDP